MPHKGRPKKSKDIDYECLTCGKRYTKPEWEVTGVKFCSRQCFYDSRKGKPRTDLRVVPQEKTCPECGTVFLVGGAKHGRYYQKYCSPDCQHKGQGYQPRPRDLELYEAAWLAGLFDGEGSIIFAKDRPAKNIRMTITNTHYPLIERAAEVVGTGTIIEMARYKKNPRHSASWNWQCYGANARNLLRQIYPHLIAKKEKADKALS